MARLGRLEQHATLVGEGSVGKHQMPMNVEKSEMIIWFIRQWDKGRTGQMIKNIVGCIRLVE